MKTLCFHFLCNVCPGEGEQRAEGGEPADERPCDPCIMEEQEKPPPPCPSESSASSEDSPDKVRPCSCYPQGKDSAVRFDGVWFVTLRLLCVWSGHGEGGGGGGGGAVRAAAASPRSAVGQ